MAIVLAAIALIAAMMFIMSVGVIFSGRCLRGSCGGPDLVGADGESLLCATCPKRREPERTRESARKNSDLVRLA